jgi:hypothetical protein
MWNSKSDYGIVFYDGKKLVEFISVPGIFFLTQKPVKLF